jgi:REP element-mobilizing transposase RayT
MGLPRSRYVQEGKEGVYHCFTRCVRRAFLHGFDAHTGRDYSHRKAWLVSRLRKLAGIFAIEVCAYAVMDNHYHTILRTRPDIAGHWTDREVARRWLTLFPRKGWIRGAAKLSIEKQIHALANNPGQIAKLRKRLSSLSWFMGRLNEHIARAANKEDEVKGRFWESRFKCQALLDEAAIASCMVYVDLNPIRGGRAEIPEGSEFTSIQERIRSWRRETMVTDPVDDCDKGDSSEGLTSDWLCPISSGNGRRGILSMTKEEYFDLVDKSGRMIRSDKRGAIDGDLTPILLRIGANPQAWRETIGSFGERFSLVAGLACNLRKFANQLGRRWFKGITEARAAFTLSPLQLA